MLVGLMEHEVLKRGDDAAAQTTKIPRFFRLRRLDVRLVLYSLLECEKIIVVSSRECPTKNLHQRSFKSRSY